MAKSLILLSFLILEVLHLEASPLSIRIEPTEGSIAGGTWITLTFDGLHPSQFGPIYSANGPQLQVYLTKPPLPRIPCDVHPIFSDASAIKCQSRSSQQAGLHWLEVTLNGRKISHFGMHNGNNCTFKYSAAQTPTVYQVNPPFGVPGNVITLFGWILTDKYETYDFNVEYIDGPALLKSEGDGWITICSFTNKQTNDIYPIQADHGLGTMQCRAEGNFIGSQNVSFSVFNIGKSVVSKDAWLISAKQELFLYQTHSDLNSVFPISGSLGGGTDITITGNFFHHPAKVTIAGSLKPGSVHPDKKARGGNLEPAASCVLKTLHCWGHIARCPSQTSRDFAKDNLSVPCAIKEVSPREMVCTSGPVEHHRLKAPQPGNRGLLFQVWNGTTGTNVTESSLGYKWGIAPNASSLLHLLHLLSGVPQLFSSRLSGFFVAPETNNYTFWIQADGKASLYFCHSEDAGHKVKVATIPAGISAWSDHWEQNWDERWQQKTLKFELKGGTKYYMEAWHHGKMPSRGMKVGVQIHNTWLNPKVVNTYHREKIEFEVRAVRLPEIQMLTLSGAGWASLSWDNVSSSLIPANATAHQIQMAIEDIVSVKCSTESSSAAILLRADFENGLDASRTEGELTVLTDPFCGRFSSLQPKHLIHMPLSMLTRYELTKYTHVCFSYKGYINGSVNVSISYTNIHLYQVKTNVICLWNQNETDHESWKFGCTDLWRNCMNSTEFPKDIQVNSMVFVHRIDLLPLIMEDDTHDWFYVDEIIVSDRNITVSQMDVKPARPGGSVLEAVSVVGSSPTFNLSFWIANCAVDLPFIALTGVLPSEGSSDEACLAEYAEYENEHTKLIVQRLQAATPPVGGTFKIQLSDTVIPGVPVNISSSDLRRLLMSNADNFTARYINASDFTVIKSLNTCYRNAWTLTWTSMIGDLPEVINVFNENLTGLDPSAKARVVSDGGVFIGPIFGDMLATANELPQVAVHVNEIPANCSGSCSFQYLQDMTPLVTDIKYSSDDGIGATVYVTGSSFTEDNQAVLIQINQTSCETVQTNTTRIICSMSRLPARGIHRVTVHVNPYGSAVNSSGESLCLMVEPRILTVEPSTSSEIGGLWVTLRVMSLDGMPLVLFGSQAALVNFSMSNSTAIVCRVPSKVEEDDVVDVTVIVGNQSICLKKAFKYEPSLNPIVVSLSRNTSSTAGGHILKIGLLLFDQYADLDMKVHIRNTLTKIKEKTSHSIEVLLPPLPLGIYNISITINGVQISSTGVQLVMQYVGNITSVEPCCGSFKGGTILTITGEGFSNNSSLVSVLLNTCPCDVISTSQEIILCQTRPITSSVGLQIINVLIRAFIGNVHSCHLGYPYQEFYFAYKTSFTSIVSSISWEIMDGIVIFYLTGTNLTDSTLLIGDSSCELEPPNPNETASNCSLLLDCLEAGRYPISVLQKQTGYADISSPLNIFELTPRVFSVTPLYGSACGGTKLTISGQFMKSTRKSVQVSLTGDYTCPVEDCDDSMIRCTLQANHSQGFMSNTSHTLNITVTVNGIVSLCQGDCTFNTLKEKTPIVDQVKHELNGTLITLQLRGQRLAHSIDELNILVDYDVPCNSTFSNETTVMCQVSHLYPGLHSMLVINKINGQACFRNVSMDFTIVPQFMHFSPKNVSTNGGGLLTIKGFAMQGKNTTTVLIGNDSCAITGLSSVIIQCVCPPGNITSALWIEVDGILYHIGELNYNQDFTPVFLCSLPSTSLVLTIMVLRITEVEQIQIFVEDFTCANVSGNSSKLQCLAPHLPAGEYQVRGYDLTRGWASSNVTFTSHLAVTAIHKNFGCLGREEVHLHGTGFSRGHTSVTICGFHCEMQDRHTTPTHVRCFTRPLNDSLAFLCGFTEDAGDSCHRNRDTYIQCDITVRVGTYSLTRRSSYVYVCNSMMCASPSLKTAGVTSFISGLFFSPKVERDEVLIYNSSCTITMATESEMECEAPNQPITTKITEIRKNWGQNMKGNISLRFCGPWSENSSWLSGRPPQDGDNVTVQRGQTLLLDTSTTVLNLLHVKGGKLLFFGPGPISLHAHYILVSDRGELRVGSQDEPFHGKAEIHLYGSGDSRPIFPYGVKFLAVRNATVSIHGWRPEIPFTHLKTPAKANDSRLVLEKNVDWRLGDEIIISGQDLEDTQKQEEVVTIETLNDSEIFIRPPLRYHHGFAEQWVDGQRLVLKPLVAVLTRDIVVRGNLTRERMSYVQHCAEAGITDLSKCIYDKSERKLGGRDQGAVVIVQTFQSEPSSIQLEGLQLQHVGQAFQKPLAALTIAGNGRMTGSYICGCSFQDSFGRGLSISRTSELRVENNIFYNLSGHGILLEEGLEDGNRIWRNAVIGISGTDALSNIETISPAGLYIRTPTNTIEENTVCTAGYGFFFHLSPKGPSQAPLQSFSRNTASLCTRSGLKVYPEYCPKSTGQSAIAVFQSFTAWRNRGGAQIHRSSNLQLKDFQMFSCRDFGIDIIESLGNTSVADSLLLGHFDEQSKCCMTAGLRTPKRFHLLISNTTFVNFDLSTCAAISTCSECYEGQGGFRVEAVQLKFLNSPHQTTFPFPHSAILEDIDGSILGNEGSQLLASMDTLPASCVPNANISGVSRGSVCGKDVVFHRMSVGLNTAPDKQYNVLLTNTNNKTITANYVHDTLSNLFGWMVLLVDKEMYTMAFDKPSVRKDLQYSATFDNFAAGNFLLMEHGSLPAHVDIMVTCGGSPGQSLQSPPSPTNNKGCDWFFNRESRKLTYLVIGEAEIQVTFKAEERMSVPPTGPNVSPTIILKWSCPESWEGVPPGWGGNNYSVPSAGDDVIILPNRTILVDIVLPPLRGLYILGTLEFPVNSSNVLSAGCIVVAGGELNIGTHQHPLEREQKVHILLRASEGIFCHRLNGINVDSGTIGVFGKFQIHSAYPKKSWTRLGGDIAPGNERILLEDAVDWNPGEHLVISASSYDAHQAELVTLKEVNKKSITIQKRLFYRHTGSIYSIEDKYFPLAAEVGLLARHVLIESDVPCAGRLHVGQLRNINGTYFTGILQLSNVEIRNFGTMQHSSIDFNSVPPGSSVMLSSIHHSCRGGIQAVASSGILLHGNVVFNTVGHGINLEGQNHTLARNLIVLTKQPEELKEWVAGIKINLADDTSLFSNAVAGSERLAFHVSGQPCDQLQHFWAENVAHSSLHGVHLYNGDGFQTCTKIIGFISYKNYDYGVMFHVRSSVVLENMTLIDNRVGLLPIVYGLPTDQHNSEKKYIELRHSVIVATSSSFDCLKDRIIPFSADSTSRDNAPFNPLRGRVGILWPTFTSEPGQWPHVSWHTVISYSGIHGIMKLQDVTFSGYVKSCYSDDNDVCLMSNPENTGVMYPIITERTTMLQTKDINKFFFHLPQPRSGENLCPGVTCDSTRTALFKDLDGSALGLASPVTVFPELEHEWMESCFNSGIYRKDSKCIYKSNLQLYFCEQIDHAMVVLNNLDSETTNISPVVSVTDTFVNVFSSPTSQDCCSCNTSTFYSTLPANKITKVCFSSQTPRRLRLYLIGGQNTTQIILAILYNVPQSLHVFVKGRYVPSSSLVSESQFMKSKHGANFFAFTENLLYVLLQGEDPIEICAYPSIQIVFTIRRATGEDSQKQMILQLADFIHIRESQIRILQNVPGSDPALKYITDNAAKRNLHCPHIRSSASINNRYGIQKAFQRKEHYRMEHSRQNETRKSEVVIVEISNSLPTPTDLSNVTALPLLSDKLKSVASCVINAQQTGELERVLNQEIDSLVVVEATPSYPGNTSENFNEATADSSMYVRPYSIYVHVQPSDGHVDKALAVQPKVIFLDKQGQRVQTIGHPQQPWLMTVQLKGSSQAMLKGNTTIVIKDGWANFSNLAVSSSGSNWCLDFSITSPPGVIFTAQSHPFIISPVPTWITSNTIWAVALGSFCAAIVLCVLLVCWFKKHTIKKTKIKHAAVLHRKCTEKHTSIQSRCHPRAHSSTTQDENDHGSTGLEEEKKRKDDRAITAARLHRTCQGTLQPVTRREKRVLGGNSSEAHASVTEDKFLAVKCDTTTKFERSITNLHDLQTLPLCDQTAYTTAPISQYETKDTDGC